MFLFTHNMKLRLSKEQTKSIIMYKQINKQTNMTKQQIKNSEHYGYITLIILQYYQKRMKQFHYMINMKTTYKKHGNL